jgi:heme-degrading monooxygenase HmoA
MIPVRSGAEDAFVETFVRLGVFGHAAQIEAFCGGELLRPHEAGEAFVVHARWSDREGYQAWLDAPIRAKLNEEIGRFVDGELTGRLYDEAGA